MLGFRRVRKGSSPHACLRMGNKLFMRFAASEPATNKALQEVRVLEGLWAVDIPAHL